MKKLLIAIACLSLAFLYGFATHRNRLFPYTWIHGVWSAVRPGASGADGPQPDKRPGMWARTQAAARRGEAPDMESVRNLAGLGYLSGYENAPDSTGVTFNAGEAAQAGFNLVLSGHAPEASIMDMAGRVLHEWRPVLAEVWPNKPSEDLAGHETFWRRVHAYPDGDLLAIYDGIGLIRLDADSKLLWSNMGGMHHDLDLDEEGNIHVLSRSRRVKHDRLTLEGPILEDFISVVSPEGEELKRTSILSCFLDSDYSAVVSLAAKQGDILHINTIEWMDGRFADRHPLFARGNVLISSPTVNTIAVIDPEAERVIWALGGQFQFQHQPTVLDSGNLLLFDNLGESGASKVIEFDPLTQEILWAYRNAPAHPLSSYFLGSCQRLANENTLITESAAGRALEVNRGGEIVWEYVNPERAGDENELIACLLEVVRIDPEYFSGEFRARLLSVANQ